MVVNLSNTATQEAFGDLVGISQQTVSELLSRKILVQGVSAGEWLRLYTSHLREMAAGRATTGDLDLAGERARLAREQADRIAMQNAVTRGELAPVALLEEVLSATASKVAGVLDAIPGMVRRRVPLLTADDIDLIAGEVAKARNAVAAMSLADILNAEPVEDVDDSTSPIVVKAPYDD